MICWWKLRCKDGWTPDSVIKCGFEVNVRSIHEEENSNIYVGSLIIWCKPNCDEILSIDSPSVVFMSFLHQLLDSTLKSPRSTTRSGLFCNADSRFSSRFSLKDSNWSRDWPGDLYNAMKLQSLSLSSNLAHSSK